MIKGWILSGTWILVPCPTLQLFCFDTVCMQEKNCAFKCVFMLLPLIQIHIEMKFEGLYLMS